MWNTRSPTKEPLLEARVVNPHNISVEIAQGSVSIDRDDLKLTISGKSVTLTKQSPLKLAMETGELEFRGAEIGMKAEGDAIKLELD